MSLRHSSTLPAYIEQAMGYVWDKPLVQWVGVYKSFRGKLIWHDGMAQDRLPAGLFQIMQDLWGALPSGHAYLLDFQERRIDILTMTALEAILEDVSSIDRFERWHLEDAEVQRVTQMLIAYGERLARRAMQQACQQCYLGYQWLNVEQQFAPCIFCNLTAYETGDSS